MSAAGCTVFFDGACPLCRRESAGYQRAEDGGRIVRVDASARPPSAPGGELSCEVFGDLRTDHAAEAGAVQIHRGILALTDDANVRAFAARRLAIEHLHLQRIGRWLPSAERSRLLPLWRAAGWLAGAAAALIGPRAVLATVTTIERVVDRSYAAQIERLSAQPQLAELRATLAACRSDRFDRRATRVDLRARSHLLGRVRAAIAGKGSTQAVAVSRRCGGDR